MHESEKWKWNCSVVSDSQQPHGLQPTRLLRPWDFPGKSTGVGSIHCLLQKSSSTVCHLESCSPVIALLVHLLNYVNFVGINSWDLLFINVLRLWNMLSCRLYHLYLHNSKKREKKAIIFPILYLIYRDGDLKKNWILYSLCASK